MTAAGSGLLQALQLCRMACVEQIAFLSRKFCVFLTDRGQGEAAAERALHRAAILAAIQSLRRLWIASPSWDLSENLFWQMPYKKAPRSGLPRRSFGSGAF
jgi:hypothetical protein